MAYVRDRLAPASGDSARLRRETFGYLHAPGAPDNWDDRFHSAISWLGSALVYSKRRSYPSAARKEWAHARRLQIIAEAAAAVQEAGNAVDAAFPVHRSSWERRQALRGAYYQSRETRNVDERPWRLDASRSWLMVGMRQARRYATRPGAAEALPEVARIVNEVAGRLAAWAEEMDSDDYGQ
jgi:hypothetical protein